MIRVLGLSALLVATTASADTRNPYLLQAKVFHQGLDFEKCLKRLEQAGKWENSTEQLADIELYTGLCQLALGKEKDATEHFELALNINDTLELPPLQGPKVTALFEKIRKKVIASKPQPPAPVAVVEAKPEPLVSDVPLQPKLTPTEPTPIVEATPPKERHVVVPIIFGVTAVAAVGVAAYFGVQAKSLEQQANAAPFESDAVAAGRQAQTNALIANVGFGLAGAAAATAVLTYLLMN